MKTIIIWLTRQIKVPKKDGTFLGKHPWWSPVLIKSQGNITEAGPDIDIFLENFQFFQKTQSVEKHTDRKALLYSLSESATNTAQNEVFREP